MASRALHEWETARRARLDEVEAACRGAGRRRRRQLVNALMLFLASEFQGFCRDLHDAAAEELAGRVVPALERIVVDALTENRRVDRGNATLANLVADFGRFDFDLRARLEAHDPRFREWRDQVELLGRWRNAIAHEDFSGLGSRYASLALARRFRRTCMALARALDAVVTTHVGALVSASTP